MNTNGLLLVVKLAKLIQIALIATDVESALTLDMLIYYKKLVEAF